ncbi:MAG TPA: formimidoylglutamate deiminase [Longimicrobiales bacterium]|nr:formimidoylglutamate deiminase [Longimicrobiales bacterium]
MRVLEADLTYINGKFESGVGVEIDDVSGRITRVAPAESLGDERFRLRARALMPGFINAHSHSFQRIIRGRTQWRPPRNAPSDFWSWRDEMYSAALTLTADDIYDVSRLCFLEMLLAGITTVGEFHYLQRDESGTTYGDPLELHKCVLQAAADVGIRIVLLNTAYVTGGVGAQLRWTQRRFNTPDLAKFLSTCDDLKSAATRYRNATVGMAPHSVRAVPRDWLKPLAEWARINNVPLHMHISEQLAEVEACAAAFGLRPVELLAAEGVLDGRVTAVHATHTSAHEIALLARARATVCACPSTERDLGDGFLPASSLHAAGVRMAIGSDSQTVIDPLTEIRSVEYHERLRRLERVVLGTALEDRIAVAPTLLRMGTQGGAASLQIHSGAIESGRDADLITIDLQDVSLAGYTAETLDNFIALSAQPATIRDIWVGGRQVVAERQHKNASDITMRYRQVAERLW